MELKLSLSLDAGILYSCRGSITLFVIDHSSEHNVLRSSILVVVCLRDKVVALVRPRVFAVVENRSIV